MVKRLVSAVAAAAGLVPAAALAAPAAPAPIVFFDIAGTDLTREAAFYKAVLGWDVGADGRLTVPVASPLPGSVRIEAAGAAPIAERVLYVGVQDIPASLEAVRAHGGSVVFPMRSWRRLSALIRMTLTSSAMFIRAIASKSFMTNRSRRKAKPLAKVRLFMPPCV